MVAIVLHLNAPQPFRLGEPRDVRRAGTVRRGLAPLLRWPGGSGRGHAVPTPRHGRPGDPRRTAPECRPPLRLFAAAAARSTTRTAPSSPPSRPSSRSVRSRSPSSWGNRNSPPFLPDALRDAAARGLHRIVVVTSSAYSSCSSCRQYRENLADAFAEVRDGRAGPRDRQDRPVCARSAFVGPNARLVVQTLRGLADVSDAELALLFVTHSIPDAMDETSGPGDGEVGSTRSSTTCPRDRRPAARRARSRPPGRGRLLIPVRTTEPAVARTRRERPSRGAGGRGPARRRPRPVGFVSDHTEVVYDLDTEAAQPLSASGSAGPRAHRRRRRGLRRGPRRPPRGARRRGPRRARTNGVRRPALGLPGGLPSQPASSATGSVLERLMAPDSPRGTDLAALEELAT